jgi:hypothetical protein
LVVASFSDAVSASGNATLVYKPVVAANTRPGSAPGRPNSPPTNEDATIYFRRIDVTLPIGGPVKVAQADRMQAFLPTSVSINPSATAGCYVASVLDAALASSPEQMAEAFQIGPTNGAHTPDGPATRVADPLREKILAGVGPLDNSLALP